MMKIHGIIKLSMRLIHGRSDFPFFDGQSMLEHLNQHKLNDANDRHLKYCSFQRIFQ